MTVHSRGDFVHWVVVDIPPDMTEIAAGSASDGVTQGGKGPSQGEGARPGLNDYTGWFAGSDELASLLERFFRDRQPVSGQTLRMEPEGAAERVVITRHALRNALLPIITLFGLNLPVYHKHCRVS